ncbi:hypothetical protein [Bacillus gobiensis]|uniref:ApeA N-terminal domain-containing protein n=1 Tax=Bacillus gobiensis TaxID=1441095 RepID=A0A0M3R8X8_9BACI|nr:hypothetical protein [Bacillus gobiensis]ALC80456.1 hypothetical protein AM592_01805 [Bacillus gobiensis]
MITGLVHFQGKRCLFKLNDFTLKIEEIEDRENLYTNDLLTLLSLKKEEYPEQLFGETFENNKDIFFKFHYIIKTSLKTYTAKINYYILFSEKGYEYDGIGITADELNWFYDIRNAYKAETGNDGELNLETIPFKNLEKNFSFNLNKDKLQGSLNISRKFSSTELSPIQLYTELTFHLENTTKNCDTAAKLYNLTNQLLSFLCYRRNITFNTITLKKKDSSGLYRKVGQLFINEKKSNITEEKKLIRERLIGLPLIEDNLSSLFQKLADKNIYLSHIPQDSKDQNYITPARFILVTARFEWQFPITFDSYKDEFKFKAQKQEIISFLVKKVAENSGELKKYFKSVKRNIERTDLTLAKKINFALNHFKGELEIFIKNLYELDDPNLSEISDRIQEQRNNFAHGNISKEINPRITRDFFVLEWLNYAMILRDLGVSPHNIKIAINNLFQQRMAI